MKDAGTNIDELPRIKEAGLPGDKKPDSEESDFGTSL